MISILQKNRCLLELQGEGILSFLHNQTTGDLKNLKPFQTTRAFLLEPKGKIVSDLWISVWPECVWCEVDLSKAEEVKLTFQKYLLGKKINLQVLEGTLQTCVGEALESFFSFPKSPHTVEGSCFEFQGARASYFPVENGSWVNVWNPTSVSPENAQAFTLFRLQRKIPLFLKDIFPGDFALQSEFCTKAVSFTKGCYMGQETMARLYSRGENVPKKLKVLEFEHTGEFKEGQRVLCEGEDVGVITSSARGHAMVQIHRKGLEEGKKLTVESQPVRCV